MATVLETQPISHPTSPEAIRSKERALNPVISWALLGGAFFVFATYLIWAWILSDDFHRTPAGPSPVPMFMKVALTIVTVVGFILTAGMFWFMVVKPWRRDGHPSTDGLFVIGYCLLAWQDPVTQYFGPYFTYNSWALNFGSWIGKAGALFPTANRTAEPVLMTNTVYVYFMFGGVVAISSYMRWVERRRPGITKLQLIGHAIGCAFVLDIILETLFLRIGYYTYAATIDSLTIFPDKYYKFPIYEPVIWAITWGTMACVRYFKDDKGRVMGERGVDELRVKPRYKSALRFFGIFGVINVIYLCMYGLPLQLTVLHADSLNKDLVKRSYLNNQFCGEGSGYACWGPGVPIARPGSTYLDENGELVPGKEPLPEKIPLQR